MSKSLLRQPAAAACGLAVLGLGLGLGLAPMSTEAATTKAKAKPGPRLIGAVPQVPNFTCAITANSSVKTPCPVFTVQTFVVVDTNGNPAGCLAAMPYNQLTVALGAAAKSGTISWQLPPDVPAVFTSNASGTGIALSATAGSSKQPSDLFNPVTAAITNGGKNATLTTVNGAVNAITLNHLPVVQYTLQGGPNNGVTVQCLGVDPIITNSDA